MLSGIIILKLLTTVNTGVGMLAILFWETVYFDMF
jgi:hypothetical protein